MQTFCMETIPNDLQLYLHMAMVTVSHSFSLDLAISRVMSQPEVISAAVYNLFFLTHLI